MAAFSHLFTDTIYVSVPVSTDAYGDLTYGDYVAMPCALEHAFTKVLDVSGNEVTSSHSMAHGVQIAIDSRVIFSAADLGDNTKARKPIITTSAPSRLTGDVLYETFF